MTAPALRVGWCPGALRPMAAGDGLLVRVKPRGHRLSIPQALAIAELSRRFGNGALNLTARGNIQLRGVAEDTIDAVTQALADQDLIDATAEGEAVRNVLSNPLAGLDASPRIDLRAAVAALEARLAGDPALWRLPAKFAWIVDDGGAFGPRGLCADIRFTVLPDASGLAITLDDAAPAAVVAADCLVDSAVRLANAFLALCTARGRTPHRIRDLVALCGAETVFAEAGLILQEATPPQPFADSPIGCHLAGASSVVTARPAFGLLRADTLTAFTQAAAQAGASDIRLAPSRSLLAGGLGEAEAAAMAQILSPTGLILDPDDPRLRIEACVGAPACHRATTPAPDDAARLAALHPGPLHVSGCVKGCAHPAPSPVTLVGRDGRYDLVRDGRPGDAPVMKGLPLADVLTMLAPVLESAP